MLYNANFCSACVSVKMYSFVQRLGLWNLTFELYVDQRVGIYITQLLFEQLLPYFIAILDTKIKPR